MTTNKIHNSSILCGMQIHCNAIGFFDFQHLAFNQAGHQGQRPMATHRVFRAGGKKPNVDILLIDIQNKTGGRGTDFLGNLLHFRHREISCTINDPSRTAAKRLFRKRIKKFKTIVRHFLAS